MAKKKFLQRKKIKETNPFSSTKQLSKELSKYAKIANERLNKLEKSGVTYYAYEKAKNYLSAKNQVRFKTYIPKMDREQLERELTAIKYFLSYKTSTIRGLNEVEKRRLQTFRDKEINNRKLSVDNPAMFYLFLSSAEFRELKRYATSEEIIEDFDRQYGAGISYDTIMNGYREFMNSEVSFYEWKRIREEAKKKKKLFR